jgi:hypothetical protein
VEPEQSFAFDVTTQELWLGSAAADQVSDDLAGCRIIAYALPEGARLEGTLLRWTPGIDQIGWHEIDLQFSAECAPILATDRDTVLIGVSPDGTTLTQNDADEEGLDDPRHSPTSTVHDLE